MEQQTTPHHTPHQSDHIHGQGEPKGFKPRLPN